LEAVSLARNRTGCNGPKQASRTKSALPLRASRAGVSISPRRVPAWDEDRPRTATNPCSCSAMWKQASYEPPEDTLRVRPQRTSARNRFRRSLSRERGAMRLPPLGEDRGSGRAWTGAPLSSSGEALRGFAMSRCPGCRPGPGNISGRVLRDATRFVGLENHLLAGSRSARGRPRSSSRSRFRLRTGPCRALGADTPRDAELRGDLACSRLGSERKYVKRIYARDTGKARRQFAR
jgi:hypothetical protein